MGSMNKRNPATPDWQNLRELYDRRAEARYRFAAGRRLRVLSRKHRGIIAHLTFPPGSRVLDAGCGDGVYCEWLSRQGHVLVVGLDISTRILAIARNNVANRGNTGVTCFLAGNLERLPLAGASFDAIVCSQVIEHLLDDQAGLSELYRVLRSSGRLVISTDNHDNQVTRWLAAPSQAIRALLRRRDWTYPFPHRDYRLAAFVARVAEAGFRIECTETYRFSLPPVLSRLPGLTRLLDWFEARLIRLPGVRQWGDIIVVVADKP